MNAPLDGGPAFPTEQGHNPDGTWNQTYESGMTLRDWFAGMALQHIPELLHANLVNKSAENIAEWSYQIADAMLAARKGVGA
jgi:hypothetical protein